MTNGERRVTSGGLETRYKIRDTRDERSSLVSRISHLAFPTLILLLAFALRVWNLGAVPPGLTHDEANHAREAIDILAGVFRFFFPLNYGSEPLYSYTVASFMALLGRGVFALRLVNAVFGTAAVAVTYAWAAPRLGRGTALLGAGLLAVSFWPLAASREALRAGMLPFFMGLAVIAFWRLLALTADPRSPTTEAHGSRGAGEQGRAPLPPLSLSPNRQSSNSGRRPAIILFGITVALTLYIYLAARVSWLLFPAFLGYLALVDRATLRRVWRPVAAGLLLAGLLVAPLFLYLRAHPEMQTRLDMLDRPLQGLAAGELAPLLLNVRDALLAFVWPGFGDQFLAYNIPGRPVLDMASAVFFVLGMLVCLLRWRRPAYAFLLLWFLTGILPSLVTGPTANTTRNLAALPAVYLIVAVGFVVPLHRFINRTTNAERSELVSRISYLVSIMLVFWIAFISARDYFVRWADSAAVRSAYQHTLVESIGHLQANYPEADPVLFSSVYPGPAHDASIALALAADRPAVGRVARWADAHYALTLPPERVLAVIPHSTPPHPAFIPYLEAIETIDVRPDDLDPRFTLYWIDGPATAAALTAAGALPQPVDFGGAVELVAARWLGEATRPGETAELLTVWRVLDPARAGPVAPPTFTTDAVTFAHVLDNEGGILAQSDRLDAPSWAWQVGDVVAQIHPLVVPASAAPGEYAVAVGVYDRATGTRLATATGEDTAAAPLLTVAP